MKEKAENLVWRSLLYVPANNPKFIGKAHTRGADAIILDLEDSVPQSERPAARAGLADAARSVAQNGADVLVRINRPLQEAVLDIEAAVMPEVAAFFVAKSESAEHLRLLEEVVEARENALGLPSGHTGFVPMVETASAFFRMAEIAGALTRNVALTLGGEDFALDNRMVPDGETLFLPNQEVVYAARAAGIVPLGTFGTVADFQDLDAYRESARKARRYGFEGSSCIHPGVVPVLNDEFAPAPEEIDHAERVVAAYEKSVADGVGAITIDGKMIDVPVAIRAQNLLNRARAIEARRK